VHFAPAPSDQIQWIISFLNKKNSKLCPRTVHIAYLAREENPKNQYSSNFRFQISHSLSRIALVAITITGVMSLDAAASSLGGAQIPLKSQWSARLLLWRHRRTPAASSLDSSLSISGTPLSHRVHSSPHAFLSKIHERLKDVIAEAFNCQFELFVEFTVLIRC
jgi:hypothetical protein